MPVRVYEPTSYEVLEALRRSENRTWWSWLVRKVKLFWL